MLDKNYYLCYAEEQDIPSWMALVRNLRDYFPGLETEESLIEYKTTLLKNVLRKTALCVKNGEELVGILLFSFNSNCLSCLAVHPAHRKKGIASAMIDRMLELFSSDTDIVVTTYREGDLKGIASRQLYKKFGFREDELVNEFGYPNQKFILHRH